MAINVSKLIEIIENQNERISNLEYVIRDLESEMVAANFTIPFLMKVINKIVGNDDEVIAAFRSLIAKYDLHTTLPQMHPNADRDAINESASTIINRLNANISVLDDE